MKTHGLLQCACAAVALLTVSACGGALRQAQDGIPVAPSAAIFHAAYVGGTLFVNGDPVTAARLNPLPRYAELVPDKKSKSKDYEYIINSYDSYASIFNYPPRIDQIGQIKGAGGQGCTNVLYGYGKKIVWNPGRTNDLITEYAVPSNKVLKTLYLDYKYTSSCAMNASGDLAIGVLLGNSSNAGGQVVIFKNATGSGKVYNTPLSKEYFDGYDPSGNLFADGLDSHYSFELVELPKGKSNAVTIKTSNSPLFPGSVQWDGKYLTVFDQQMSEAYQYSVRGTTAILKHTIAFTGAGDCAQTWIVQRLLYCGDAGNNAGLVFRYPRGGKPLASFKGNFDLPLGATAVMK